MVEYQSIIVNVLRDEYGIEVKDISLLEGFVDRTFRINTNEYIAKLVLDADLQDKRALDSETSLIKFLHENSFPVASIIPTKAGALSTTVEITEPGKQETIQRPVRVVSFLNGALWSQKSVNPEICETVGRFVGRLDATLEKFKDDYYISNGNRNCLVSFGDDLDWDCRNLKELVKDDERKHRISEQILHLVDTIVNPVIEKLPMQQIHYDCHWRNLMVDDGCKEIVGLIDFGTSRYTCRIFEVTNVIPVLYAHDSSSDLSYVRSFMKGYRSKVEMTDVETEILFTCIIGRILFLFLCLEKMKILNPSFDTSYITSMFGNGWDILDDLLNRDDKKTGLQAALLG